MAEQTSSTSNLSDRTVKSGLWVFILKGMTRLFQFVRTLVLARLLSPDDFGLFGIAMLSLALLETFSETGFRTALIQRDEDIHPYLDTAWTLEVGRGLTVALVLLVVAPPVAHWFSSPGAVNVIRAIGLAALLQSLTNIAVVHFEKNLEFRRYFAYQVVYVVADIGVSVVAAILLRSVWALVLGLVVGNLARMVASYIIHPYRPRFSLNLPQAGRLFRYGRWVLGAGVLMFIGYYLDDILVGTLLGTAALGLYQMAYKISNLPSSEISLVINQVTLPAYARLQNERERLRLAYLRVVKLSAVLSTPLAVAVVVLAGEFTRVFLGSRWLPMVPAMQILALAGWLKSLALAGTPFFKGSGRPQDDFFMHLVRDAVMVALIYPLVRWGGMSGAAVCALLSVVAMSMIWIRQSLRAADLAIGRFMSTLVGSLLAGGAMAGCLAVVKLVGVTGRSLVAGAGILAGVGLAGVLIYAGVIYGLGRIYPVLGVEDELRSIRQAFVR